MVESVDRSREHGAEERAGPLVRAGCCVLPYEEANCKAPKERNDRDSAGTDTLGGTHEGNCIHKVVSGRTGILGVVGTKGFLEVLRSVRRVQTEDTQDEAMAPQMGLRSKR